MKLTESLPEGVTVNGRFYRLDFDFRNVLRMMDVLGNSELLPEAREYLALKCLMKRPKNVSAVLAAVKALLFDKKPGGGERLTSFEQDAPMIRTAFRQEYGIDLFRDRLHWMEFTELLQHLPEGNRYEEVLGIRARPMPAPTKYNAKEREWLMKAKQQCALHLSDTEAARKYDEDVGRVFNGLLGAIMASKEVVNDGE
jgi:hypothetical protein